MALEVAMDLWNGRSVDNLYLYNMDDDWAFFRLGAKQNGLLVHRMKGHLNIVEKLNLPAILEFYHPASPSPRYLTLSKKDGTKTTLRGGEQNEAIEAKQDEIESYWSGVAYIPWKHFRNYRGIIPHSATGDSIITLKMLMKDIGFSEIDITPSYDDETREAVKEIQRRHGLIADGIVGARTKIVIYNENKSFKIPHIVDESSDQRRASPDLRGEAES